MNILQEIFEKHFMILESDVVKRWKRMKGKKIITICVLTLVCVIALPATGMTTIKNEIKNKSQIMNESLPINWNNPPNPPIINGPHSGNTKQYLHYQITITDPDIDDIMFFLEVDFGDEIEVFVPRPESCWRSGDVVDVSYKWKDPGPQQITARVQDCSGEWSEWGIPFDVSITKSKEVGVNFYQLFKTLFERFPILAQVIS